MPNYDCYQTNTILHVFMSRLKIGRITQNSLIVQDKPKSDFSVIVMIMDYGSWEVRMKAIVTLTEAKDVT